MLKIIATVKRRPDVSRDQLFESWEKVHAPNIAQHAKPDIYRVTFFDGVMGGGEPPYDGMATFSFDSFESFKQGLANVPPDPFMDLVLQDETSYLYATETVAVDGEVDRDSAKATFFVTRQDTIDEAAHFGASATCPTSQPRCDGTPVGCATSSPSPIWGGGARTAASRSSTGRMPPPCVRASPVAKKMASARSPSPTRASSAPS